MRTPPFSALAPALAATLGLSSLYACGGDDIPTRQPPADEPDDPSGGGASSSSGASSGSSTSSTSGGSSSSGGGGSSGDAGQGGQVGTPLPYECPGTPGPEATCAWLASADNCWASTLQAITTCLSPNLGRYTANRAGCTYASGHTTTITPPMPPTLQGGEVVRWETKTPAGERCVSGTFEVSSAGGYAAGRFENGAACASYASSKEGIFLTCGGQRRLLGKEVFSNCQAALYGMADDTALAYWGTNGLGHDAGEFVRLLFCQ